MIDFTTASEQGVSLSFVRSLGGNILLRTAEGKSDVCGVRVIITVVIGPMASHGVAILGLN